MEVAEAVGLAIDKLHFVVEAFGDSVVAGEAPHGHDFLRPGGEGLAELGQSGMAQLVNGTEKARHQLLTLSAVAMFGARREAMTSGAATSAVRQQGTAMGCELFEVGVFRPETAGTDAGMLLRVWDLDTLLDSVLWLRQQNHAGRHIYIRPKGEDSLSLVDDLKLRLPSARGTSPRRVLTN